MKIIQLLAVSVLAISSTVVGATVWIPDINTSTGDYQAISFVSFGVSSAKYDLVLFDAGSMAAIEPSMTSLTLADLSGIVEISANAVSPPYLATYGSDIATLGASAMFELALYNATADAFTFVSDYKAIIPGNWYSISFGDIAGEIMGVDLAPVPVPATVWLLGSGLIGLVAVARRRTDAVT